MHRRNSPVDYGFTSRMFFWLLDLAEIDSLAARLPLLSHNRPNVYTFRDDDHLYLGYPTLRDNVVAYLRENGVDAPVGRIELLTSLRVLGYVFNPVSFFFVRDEADAPLAIVVEVHNTYGELKPFLFTRADGDGELFAGSRQKDFYISPFSPLEPRLDLRLRFPSDRLALTVNTRHAGAERPFFASSLTGQRRPLTTAQLAGFSLRFPLVTLKVITLIHWHAFWLWRAGVPVHRKSAHLNRQTGIRPKKGQPGAPPMLPAVLSSPPSPPSQRHAA